MLYLHCGWPRTSTTSLQNALYGHREELAAVGLVYPQEWMFGGASHHRLIGLLKASRESAGAFEDLKRFLDDHADEDVVFSVEGFTFWLSSDETLEALLALLRAAEESMPATCLWTLRRFDEALASFYLLRLALGFSLPPPDQYFRQGRREDALFGGMRAVDDALVGRCVYAEYGPDGAHNRQLLRALGIPDELVAQLEGRMEAEQGLNPSMTRKQATICLNLDLFSARIGVELDREALRKAVYSRALKLEDDGPCELMDDETARAVHERALTASRAVGFDPYVDFYADALLGARSPVSLDPSIVTDEDLERLVNSLDAVSGQ